MKILLTNSPDPIETQPPYSAPFSRTIRFFVKIRVEPASVQPRIPGPKEIHANGRISIRAISVIRGFFPLTLAQ